MTVFQTFLEIGSGLAVGASIVLIPVILLVKKFFLR